MNWVKKLLRPEWKRIQEERTIVWILLEDSPRIPWWEIVSVTGIKRERVWAHKKHWLDAKRRE
ncbi:hypothetical protein J4211_01160 [Candidatus Woesearchaeota archaeon]|nr:hypothetical protein [Candidatus Woesearchaeota archaeon]